MPTMPDVPQVLKIQFVHLVSGKFNAWTALHYRYSGTPPSVTDLNNFSGAVGGAWASDCGASAHTNVTLTNCITTDLTSKAAAQGQASFTHVGTRPGTALTANDAVLCDLLISRRYRGGKPRQYWPFGVVEDLANPAEWLTAFVNAVGAALGALFADIRNLTWTGGTLQNQVSVSFFQGFKVVTDPITGRARNVPELRPSPVVDIVAGSRVPVQVGTQRRRQRVTG